MTGATSASAHSRAMPRTACCSGVRSKFIGGFGRLGDFGGARRPSGGGRGVPSSTRTSSPRAPPRSGASACPPIPPRRGVRSPPCCAGWLARRRRPALRGALRLVGFAPDGTPLPPPAGRMFVQSCDGILPPPDGRWCVRSSGGERSYGGPDVVADEADDVLGCGTGGE